MPSVKNAAIYACYNTDSQHPESIEDQINVCKAKAAEVGIVVLDNHIFSDIATSGTRKDRPSLLALVETAKRGEISAVFVDDLSG